LISYRGKAKPAWRVASKEFAATPLFPGTPRVNVRRPEAPRAPGNLPGVLLAALALAALLGVAAVDVWLFRGLRAARFEGGEVVPLRREAHGDDVAVGHDVVAAFEA